MPDTAEEAEALAAGLHFPPDFMLGAATAAYQVEGGLHKCNWAAWERNGRNHGHFAGKACDMWNLFEADVARMKALGIRMYRFSVDWSRCEPSEGRFDKAAVDRYVSWCKLLRANGIEPMVTLHHFVEPEWFDNKGGWELSENVAYFTRFVEHVAPALCPHCTYWCTLNELNGFAMCGWVGAVHPPGKQDDAIGMIKVIKNMLVGHTQAVKVLRKVGNECPQLSGASAGSVCAPTTCLALSHIIFTPMRGWGPLALLASIFSVLIGYLFNFVSGCASLAHTAPWPSRIPCAHRSVPLTRSLARSMVAGVPRRGGDWPRRVARVARRLGVWVERRSLRAQGHR